MQTLQMKLQKPILIFALIVGALTFVYALGFATDFYTLNYCMNPQRASRYVEGAELYLWVQPYNRQLLAQGLILFLLAASNFLFMSHKRRLYYPMNYVSGVAYSGFAAYVGFILIQYAAQYNQMYLSLDFDRLEEIAANYNLPAATRNPVFMNLGMALSILMFVAAVLVIVNLVVKTLWMSKEKQMIRQAAAAE